MEAFFSGWTGALDTLTPGFVSFLINYWLHSSVLLLAVFMAVRLQLIKGDANGEKLLKVALLLGVVSALIINIRPFNLDTIWRIKESKPQTQHTNIVQGTRQFSAEESVPTDKIAALAESATVSTNRIADTSRQNMPVSTQDAPQKTGVESLSKISFWLAFYWGIGVLIMLALQCYQRYQLHLMMQHKTPLKDVMLLSGLASLKQQAAYKGHINLYSSAILTSPVVLNSKDIVLPEVFVTQYSSAQQQAALAHELAHLKRKDMHWQWLYQTFDVVFFFQPLNKLIRKEIYQIVEQRADDMASQWTGDPRALAEALSVTAKQIPGTKHTQWVLAMKCEKSNLLVRVENLLKGGVAKTKAKTIATLAILWSMFLVSAPGISLSVSVSVAALAAQQPTSIPNAVSASYQDNANARSASSSHSFSFSEIEDDYGVGNMSISSSTDDTSWTLTSKLTGKIHFNDEETEIVYFPEDSELDVRIDDGKDKRRLVISRDKGPTEYSYYLNRQQKDIAQDSQWMAQFIPELLRMTGWNAKERTEKLFAQGGLAAVLDEVQLIIGEEAKTKYFVVLPELKTFSPQEVDMIFQSVAVIHSDFHKSRTVRLLFQKLRFEGDAWFTDGNWKTLLEATHDIESDMEMARVMRSMVMAVPLESQVWPAVFAQLETVQSDFELARLLKELITHRPLQQLQLREMLQLTSTIESDFELSGLLIHMAEHLGIPDSVADDWLDSASTLQSDFEMSRAIKARAGNNMSSNELVQVIRLASNEIQSDYELASVFKVLIEQQDITGIVRDEMRDSLGSIQSDHERQGVINELQAMDI